jgi:predicted nucleic acid-binding protein
MKVLVIITVMRVLLDTNIIIHREASRVINSDIGILFRWLDRLKMDKCIHPITIEELNRHKDLDTVKSMNIKIDNYTPLKTEAPLDEIIQRISAKVDSTDNDKNDTRILNEVYCNRVDLLISEDRKIHTKAKLLGVSEKVFTIDTYLEKVTAEYPDLVDYKVLAVKKQYFGQVDLKDHFFDSFREDYQEFDKWFNKKSDDISYVCYQNEILSAFLFIKTEYEDENYGDISPAMPKKKRLKIGTFKVTSNGYKIGERFLKIIFDNAHKQKVDEIYVTIFDKREEQQRLIGLLEEWGFKYYGIKKSNNGEENVYVKDFKKGAINLENPKLTYPFLSRESRVFIVPIKPEYHTELFPDSILNTESPNDFVENEPHRNALSKVFVSRGFERNMKGGDTIVFYRTGGLYKGVATTIGVVESVIDNIADESSFLALCRKRSVFNDEQLRDQWNERPKSRPFITNFLFVASFPNRPNLKWLNDNGIIPDIMDTPQGFREISREAFNTINQYAFKK